MIFGEPAHLAFDLRWGSGKSEMIGLGWGSLRTWVGGRLVWANENNEGVLWTWVDLLEHLGRAWGHLCYEENAPYGLLALGPEMLRTPELLKGVRGVDPETVERAVHAYQHRHDLAAGLKGISLPPVWILPVGNAIRVRCEGRDVFAPRTSILSTFEQFAAAVVDKVRKHSAPRALVAIARWESRKPSTERVRAWRTSV